MPTLKKPKNAKDLPFLRKCIHCGIEAKSEDDLGVFMAGSRQYYGKANVCKSCGNAMVARRHDLLNMS